MWVSTVIGLHKEVTARGSWSIILTATIEIALDLHHLAGEGWCLPVTVTGVVGDGDTDSRVVTCRERPTPP